MPTQYYACVDVKSHHVRFHTMMPECKRALYEFCERLIDYDQGYDPRTHSYYKIPKRVFAASPHDRRELRFHINHYKDVLDHLNVLGIKTEHLKIEHFTPAEGVDVDSFVIDDKIQPYEYQLPVIDHFLTPGVSKTTNAPTGSGKSLMSMWAAMVIAKRTVMVVPAKYITEGKWIGDITKTLNVPREKLCVVKGSKAMRTIIDLGLAGEMEYDFIIISATTMYNFYKAYEEGRMEEEGYNCNPDELYTVIGAGLRIIDEVHENFHLNYMQDLYGHVAKTIYMSATLVSDNSFINSMLEVAYPVGERITPEYDGKYIACTALTYRCNKVELLPHKRRKMYSQMLFEASILKKKFRSEAYAEMIYEIIVNEYISIREPGQKMMIFADTIEMCTFLTTVIKPRLEELVVNRFVGEDPDEYLYESDVVITTPKSAGTAVDIKGLKVTLLTSAIGSRQLNAQILGRLRKLRGFKDNVPRFFYLVCEDIDSHVKYHERKLATFSDKVKTHRTLQTQYSI